ncbi:hypothetical protein Bmul_3415 [Burkholderia multivorans ATCC 17616]|nr:hypothetical protein Bmul_3415 [Burkholderia multivorans ATCC 17616]
MHREPRARVRARWRTTVGAGRSARDAARGARSPPRHSTHAATTVPTRAAPRQAAIVESPARRVLAGLRTRDDDFRIYQGNRRYAEIVAAHAPNAQDVRIFAT